MIAFLIIVVIIVGIGATVLAYRNRPESSIESGISSFRREMRALAPPGQRRGAAAADHATTPDEEPSPEERRSDEPRSHQPRPDELPHDEPRHDGPRHDGPVPGAG